MISARVFTTIASHWTMLAHPNRVVLALSVFSPGGTITKDSAIVEMQFHAVYKKVSQHKWLLLLKKLVSFHPKNMCAESKIAKFRN